MSHKSKNIFFRNNAKRRNEAEREIETPRIEVIAVEDYSNESMVIDDTSPIPSPSSSQNCNEVSREMKRLRLDSTVEGTCVKAFEATTGIIAASQKVIEGASNVAQNFAIFAPFISQFFEIGKEILSLYEKAEHNKEICSFLLQRCNCARVAVEDLDMRKTENVGFFSKQENLELFKSFIDCMQNIKKFIGEISQLNKIKKYFFANNIEETFTKRITEFEGCMNSLNFSFTVQSRNELITIKNEIRQLTELLSNIHGVADTQQSKQEFFNGINLVTKKNRDFRKQNYNLVEYQDSIEEKEPLLEGQFRKTNDIRSKKIEKRTSFHNCDEYCFKEFPNNSSSPSSSLPINQSNNQIEIRRQVNILKELKNSNHIIKFFGVAHENSKFYLVTEWMEYGNLHEYYTKFRENMNWKTKIRFALDICRGVSYLNDCQILHHDIQSANILVNADHKVKIANFGLSKKFSEFTRNISANIENVRYMAPEILLRDEDGNNTTHGDHDAHKKKVPYDSKCEIYSVGALLWEIAELKKPHSDINNTEMLVNIRKRVCEKHREPLSDDVPKAWIFIVKRAMEHEPEWRLRISEICFELYDLSKEKEYSDQIPRSPYSNSDDELIIDNHQSMLTVEEAIKEHKNGNKQLAWQSFKHHSESNTEAKYWLGYYYYYAEVPELQRMDQEERHKIYLRIFKETADMGNASAQLRYGMHLWKVNDYPEAIKYLEMSAKSGNSTALYNLGSAYWNGNCVKKDQTKGADYLRSAASQNQPKAMEMCRANNITF